MGKTPSLTPVAPSAVMLRAERLEAPLPTLSAFAHDARASTTQDPDFEFQVSPNAKLSQKPELLPCAVSALKPLLVRLLFCIWSAGVLVCSLKYRANSRCCPRL